MSAKQASAGKRAYKLYNRIGATDRDKVQAQILINAEKPEDLDVYGRFVRAFLSDDVTSWDSAPTTI